MFYAFRFLVLCRSSPAHRSVRSIYKNTAYAFVHTGVWHNPRKQKQKQYIPKYALTDCQLFPFISCQTYVCTDWFVSNNMLCSRARNNQPLLIACKSIKIFQHIQIFMKKNSFFCPFKAKTNLCTTHFSVCTALRVQRYNNFLIYEDFFLFLISV